MTFEISSVKRSIKIKSHNEKIHPVFDGYPDSFGDWSYRMESSASRSPIRRRSAHIFVMVDKRQQKNILSWYVTLHVNLVKQSLNNI